MSRIQIDLPEEIIAQLGGSASQAGTRAREAVVLDLVRRGEVSASCAASVLGISMHEMVDLLAEHRLALVDYDPAELEAEVDRPR